MSTADRIARLPQWAQAHIRMLEHDRDAAKADLREVLGTAPEETDTMVRQGYGEEPIRLPAGSRVKFGTGGRLGGIECRWEGGALEVLGPGGTLAIEPRVSNRITIRAIR